VPFTRIVGKIHAIKDHDGCASILQAIRDNQNVAVAVDTEKQILGGDKMGHRRD
jgi:hypothetical protein